MVQCMYCRYSGPSDGRHSVCTVEAILDNCFTELVFRGLSLPFWLHPFLTVSTPWMEMGISEKKGGLPGFDIDILNTFLPTEMTARLPGKISKHIPTAEGFKDVHPACIFALHELMHSGCSRRGSN